MEKQLKDYLPFYMGCDYWTNNSQGNLNEETLCNVMDMCDRNKGVQLHLRPISSINENEAIECEDFMYDGFPDAIGQWENIGEFLKTFINPWPSEYRPGFSVYVKAINWLRKNGFDCDELIEAGLAIDKTTQTASV